MFVVIFLLSLHHPSERFQKCLFFYLPLLNAVAKKTIREKNTGGASTPLHPQVTPVAQSTWL